MSFVAAARHSLRAYLRNSTPAVRAGARRMASSHAPYTPKSDRPWIFLYLVSPSARKSTHAHAVHNDAHDFPGHQKHVAVEESVAASVAESEPELEAEPTPTQAEPTIMTDDEGTPADVSESLHAEAEDIPKVETSSDAAVEETKEIHAEPQSQEIVVSAESETLKEEPKKAEEVAEASA
ncbi:hypothetical protein H0H81_009397 [Sphagnurus paluster]|uniref:Uncharacterized protein n=1 Tax=Sphagnurus paluster TaxID=117069 RepID=A0A9P7K5C4_9AGAR|nr:hypothetical protein H0H81_009397 [Sphagnurus paluster]